MAALRDGRGRLTAALGGRLFAFQTVLAARRQYGTWRTLWRVAG